MRKIITLAAAGLAAIASLAQANPNVPPDAEAAIREKLGARGGEITLSDEEITRDGLRVSYFARYEASVPADTPSYAPVDTGDGYVVIQPLLAAGDPIMVTGNILGAYVDGAWRTLVNVIEERNPGGRPYGYFSSQYEAVLMAGEADLGAFLKARKEAITLAHDVEMQRIAHQAEEDALRAEKAAEQAEADRKAKAELEAKLFAERKRKDEVMLGMLSITGTYPISLESENARYAGTMEVVNTREAGADIRVSYDLGSGNSYQAMGNIHLTPGGDRMLLELPYVNNFKGSRDICHSHGVPNFAGGFVLFEGQNWPCSYNIRVEGLDIEAAAEAAGEN